MFKHKLFLPEEEREVYLTRCLSLNRGNIFLSKMQTLTIPVNTVGVMGKGLALSVRQQFPDVYIRYRDLCRRKIIIMGRPYLYERKPPWFLLFPTKNHWRENADFNGIVKGLQWLVDNYKKEGITSLAVPALGCGLGKLQWNIVGPTMCKYLIKLDIPVKLYLPAEKEIPPEQLTENFLLKQAG